MSTWKSTAGTGGCGETLEKILRLCTHGAPTSDVMELYTSFGWARLCAQVSVMN